MIGNTTKFQSDISSGRIGELIFKDDFLDFLNIKYQDVTGCQQYQVIDSDFLSKIGLFEIKSSYKDDKKIVIEEYTNVNECLGKISYGWWHKSRADLIIFVSKTTRTMIFLPFTQALKDHYEAIKFKYELIRNKETQHNGSRWQSAFRKIDLQDLRGYFSCYKKA
jgi:hypothetical protein